MNVSLPKHLDGFIMQQIRDGRFRTKEEVIVTAIRQMEESERQREMEAFQAAFREIDEGLLQRAGTHRRASSR